MTFSHSKHLKPALCLHHNHTFVTGQTDQNLSQSVSFPSGARLSGLPYCYSYILLSEGDHR